MKLIEMKYSLLSLTFDFPFFDKELDGALETGAVFVRKQLFFFFFLNVPLHLSFDFFSFLDPSPKNLFKLLFVTLPAENDSTEKKKKR